jgi:hypothetical protein
MFNTYLNNKLITDTFNQKRISNTFRSETSGYINGTAVANLSSRNPKELLVDGDTVTIEVLGIPEQYGSYFTQVDEQAGRFLPIFSGPPANVITNINPKDKAVGYFVAYSVSRISRVFNQ